MLGLTWRRGCWAVTGDWADVVLGWCRWRLLQHCHNHRGPTRPQHFQHGTHQHTPHIIHHTLTHTTHNTLQTKKRGKIKKVKKNCLYNTTQPLESQVRKTQNTLETYYIHTLLERIQCYELQWQRTTHIRYMLMRLLRCDQWGNEEMKWEHMTSGIGLRILKLFTNLLRFLNIIIFSFMLSSEIAFQILHIYAKSTQFMLWKYKPRAWGLIAFKLLCFCGLCCKNLQRGSEVILLH